MIKLHFRYTASSNESLKVKVLILISVFLRSINSPIMVSSLKSTKYVPIIMWTEKKQIGCCFIIIADDNVAAADDNSFILLARM